MEEEEDISSPFWLQNSSTNRRRLHRSYSIFLSSGTVVIILLVATLAFILVIVPTLHSFISHIFKPNSVKKSWDSLNLLLVLFAIFCGFLSKNNNSNESPRSYEDHTFLDTNTRQEFEKPNPETETQPPSWYEYSEDRTPYNRLRSFNSYPDLRQESWWVTGDDRWRFSDDTRVNGYNRGLDLNLKEEKEETSIKSIEVNTSLKGKNKKKQTLEKHQSDTNEKMKNNNVAERKNKKASATKDEKTYQSLKGKRKKKHRHKSVENFQSLLNSEPTTTMSSSSSFDNLFYSKKNKEKKHKSVSQPQRIVSKTKDEDFSVIIGNESPLISIPPPPPPPPPFKMPAWKFKVQGDFVRIDSISSTSSGLADIDDDEVLELAEPGIDLLVYPNPNPDVDNKAGSFIESFRAGLRMENMNFTKNQGIGDSNLYNNLNKRRN